MRHIRLTLLAVLTLLIVYAGAARGQEQTFCSEVNRIVHQSVLSTKRKMDDRSAHSCHFEFAIQNGHTFVISAYLLETEKEATEKIAKKISHLKTSAELAGEIDIRKDVELNSFWSEGAEFPYPGGNSRLFLRRGKFLLDLLSEDGLLMNRVKEGFEKGVEFAQSNDSQLVIELPISPKSSWRQSWQPFSQKLATSRVYNACPFLLCLTSALEISLR